MTPPPPSSLRHLSGVVGRLAAAGHGGAALKLINEKGGGRVYLPATKNVEGSALAELIGAAAAAALVDLAGEARSLDIPPPSVLKPGAKAAVLADCLAGELTTLEIARRHGVTEKYVRMLKAQQGCASPPGGVKLKGRKKTIDPRQMDIEDFLAETLPH